MKRTTVTLAIVAGAVTVASLGCRPTARPSERLGATAPASIAATPAATAPATPAPTLTPVGEATGVSWSFAGLLPSGWALDEGAFIHSEGASIEVLADQSLMAADCDLRPEAGVGSSAAEIVGALAARRGLRTASIEAVRVGGLTGRQIDVTLAPDWTGTCSWWDDPTKPVVPLVGAFDAQHYWLFTAVAEGEAMRYVVLDVPGGRNVIVGVATTAPEELSEVIAPAMDIVGRLEFRVTRGADASQPRTGGEGGKKRG